MSTIFPIGLDLGPVFIGENPQSPDHYQVQVSAGIFVLSEEEHQVWSAAHGTPELVPPDAPWGKSEVIAAVGQFPADQTASLVDSLIRDGVLVEVGESSDEKLRFAQQYRVFPLQKGLGNLPTMPWLFRIGSSEQEHVALDVRLFQIWSNGHSAPSLWEVCCERAAVNETLSLTANLPSDTPAELLEAFLTALPPLLANQCAYVDRSL